MICNFALRDLPMFQSQNALVANKFHLNVDSRAPVCHWKHLRQLSSSKSSNNSSSSGEAVEV